MTARAAKAASYTPPALTGSRLRCPDRGLATYRLHAGHTLRPTPRISFPLCYRSPSTRSSLRARVNAVAEYAALRAGCDAHPDPVHAVPQLAASCGMRDALPGLGRGSRASAVHWARLRSFKCRFAENVKEPNQEGGANTVRRCATQSYIRRRKPQLEAPSSALRRHAATRRPSLTRKGSLVQS
jgi:hypothetical protein